MSHDDSETAPVSKLRCLECRTPIGPRSETPTFPFCSARCKQVDLGRWLNEEISISVTREETERDAASGLEEEEGER